MDSIHYQKTQSRSDSQEVITSEHGCPKGRWTPPWLFCMGGPYFLGPFFIKPITGEPAGLAKIRTRSIAATDERDCLIVAYVLAASVDRERPSSRA